MATTSAEATIEVVAQAVRLARAGRLEPLQARLSDLIGHPVTLRLDQSPQGSTTSRRPELLPAAVGHLELAALQPRMASVLALIVEGRSDKEIAITLGVRHSTARTYVHRLCRSLRVSGRRGVHAWFQQGIERTRGAPSSNPG